MLAVISLQARRVLPDRDESCILLACSTFTRLDFACRLLGVCAALFPLHGGAVEQRLVGHVVSVQGILPALSYLALMKQSIELSHSPFRRAGGRVHQIETASVGSRNARDGHDCTVATCRADARVAALQGSPEPDAKRPYTR